MILDFVKSNYHRQYPFVAGCGALDEYGVTMPSDILVMLRITLPSSCYAGLYVDKVRIQNYYINFSFMVGSVCVGYSSGHIEDNNTTLTITGYNGEILGSLIVGNRDSVRDAQTYHFSSTSGLIETSTILVVDPPALSKLNINGNAVSGNVLINSTTVNITQSGQTVALSVKNASTLTSRSDKLAKNLDCSLNVIGSINNVAPDANGNINIYAISPLKIARKNFEGTSVLELSTGNITKDKLCKLVNLPPDNHTDTYPDITTVTNPEWRSWPQYN